MAPFRPNGKFLDVATGTGDVLIEAMNQHPEYQEYYGVDISAEMLSLAEKKIRPKKNSDRVAPLKIMSAESLTLPDATFDCATISFGLRNVVDRDRAIQEFYRVLKPGGSLLILEFFIPKKGLLGALFQLYFHHILPAIGGIFSDRRAYKYLPESVGSFYSPLQMRQALYNVGFNVEDSKNFLFGACRIYKAVK
jgi:demethylmenaquinone methyltransferase/2-methoxy-6-polyprenyl-1,4-benzoquinol methylase